MNAPLSLPIEGMALCVVLGLAVQRLMLLADSLDTSQAVKGKQATSNFNKSSTTIPTAWATWLQLHTRFPYSTHSIYFHQNQ